MTLSIIVHNLLTQCVVSSVASVVLELIVLIEGVVGPAGGPDQLQLAVELVIGGVPAVDPLAEPNDKRFH